MLRRLGPALDPEAHLDQEEEIKRSWTLLAGYVPAADPEHRTLSRFWAQLACGVDGAPFVLATFLGSLKDSSSYSLAQDDPQVVKLAGLLLTDECPAYEVTDEATRMRLHELIQTDSVFRASTAAPPHG